MKLEFATVDVFTDRRFGGNPLAVVPEAQGLSTEQMQAIAAEFNYSESTFVLPPDDRAHTARVRIFTRTSEIPFAGHPNVGTAFALALVAEWSARTMASPVVFEEAAGLVPVELMRDPAGRVQGATLTAPQSLTMGDKVPVAVVGERQGSAVGDDDDVLRHASHHKRMAPSGRVLAAPDKFRGTATAPEVASAVAAAARGAGWECDEAPVADGGEGTLEALGGRVRTARVYREAVPP